MIYPSDEAPVIKMDNFIQAFIYLPVRWGYEWSCGRTGKISLLMEISIEK
jgi:hypothetical protein